MVPQVEFSTLSTLPKEMVDRIKRVGSVVIRNIVDDAEARSYKTALEQYVQANPQVEGKFCDSRTVCAVLTGRL